ncbi:unnamed protein product [Rotaria sordida]|uniref:Uncharacterized protein n=1 Tax=Rotaria sordida TaxID=392033 RepID=A0A815N550_9BILA|nr:unnamed protein product [Rotaria sordida]
MASPILSKAWFNNSITGLPYTGIFKNYAKSKSKMIRLNNALGYLINNSLIQYGTGNKKHLVGARRETFMKTPPSNIRTDKNKLTALELININIDEYEHIYMNSPLPANIQLTEETIKLILSNEEYTPIVHLFNDIRIEQEMEHRIASHTVQQEIIQGKKQYHIVSSSQRVDNDNTYIQNIFEFDLDSLSNNNNNSSTSDVPFLPIDNLLPLSSSSSHIEESHLFSSLYRSNLTTASSTKAADLQHQNNEDIMSFEHELYEIEQELLQDSRYLSNFTGKNIINNMFNENILAAQVPDPVNTPVIMNNELYELIRNATDIEKQKVQNKNQSELTIPLIEFEPNLSNSLREAQTINPSQPFELIPDLIQNKNRSCKRLLEEENESSRKKQQKNTTDENEVDKWTTSSVGHKWSLTQPVFSSPINTNSTITIGDTHVDEYNVNLFNSIHVDTNMHQNNSTSFAHSSTVTNTNTNCDDVAAMSLIVNMLVDNVVNTINSNICQNGMFIISIIYNYKRMKSASYDEYTIQLDLFHSDDSQHITPHVSMSNSVPTTDYQHNNTNKSSLLYTDMSRQGDTELFSFDTATSSSNIHVQIGSKDDGIKINLGIDKPSLDNEKNDSYLSTEKDDDQIFSQIYRKLILSDSIVMSKADICVRLKHMSISKQIRNQAINNLVNDKLLVTGDWFSLKNIKSIVNFTGYLKGFPKNDVLSQMEFAGKLAKYAIDFIDFEQSFRKDKVGALPRTLDTSDIKQSKWLYSQTLMDTILSYNFLKERLVIDPSAVIYSSNNESQYTKRIRKPKKTFSPSDEK